MPSERYEIYVTDRGVSQNAPTVASAQNAESGTSFEGVNKYIASTLIKPVILSTVEVVTSQVEAATGSKRLQQQVDFVKSGIDIAVNAVESAVKGALIFSGPAGVALGLAIFAANQAIGVTKQRIQLGLAKMNEAEELAIARDRAGIQYSGGR